MKLYFQFGFVGVVNPQESLPLPLGLRHPSDTKIQYLTPMVKKHINSEYGQ